MHAGVVANKGKKIMSLGKMSPGIFPRGEVASEEQVVDRDLRQEGLGFVLLLRVEYLTEVKAR